MNLTHITPRQRDEPNSHARVRSQFAILQFKLFLFTALQRCAAARRLIRVFARASDGDNSDDDAGRDSVSVRDSVSGDDI